MTTPFASSAFGYLPAADRAIIDALPPEQQAAIIAALEKPQAQPVELTPGSLRERASNLADSVFGSLGYESGAVPMAIADFMPGTGEILAADDTVSAFGRGNILEGLLYGSGALLGAFPFVGGPIRRATSEMARSLRPAIELTDIPSPNIVQTVPKEVSTAERVATTGAYRGAPRGINSGQKLGGLRKRLKDSVRRGVIGKDWYQLSSDSATRLTGGRPGYKDRYSGTVALTSQGAQVPANQVFGVRGYNQSITGNPIITGRFPEELATDMEGMISGAPTEFGPKRGPFYEALNVAPGEAAARPTNDLWMARAFDYRTPDGEIWSAGLGEAQHRFMDKEINNLVDWANTNKVGGESNWTPEKVQASIWVDTKSRFEGKPLETAAYNFSDDLDQLTANINVESEAARGLNHLAGTQTNPKLAQRLQAGQRGLLSTPTGEDLIALEAGALTRPTAEGFGYYKGESAPADVVRILAAPARGSNVIDVGSQQLAEGVAATQGLLRGQESVGYNFVRDAGALDRNAGAVSFGRAPTQNEMLTVGKQLDDEFGGAIIPANTAQGVNFLNVGDPSQIRTWARNLEGKKSIKRSDFPATAEGLEKYERKVRTAVQNRINQISKTAFGAKAEFGLNTGDLVGSFEAYKPSAYLPAIEQSGVAEQLSRAAQQAAPALEKLDAQLVREFPEIGVRNQILMRTRQALAEGGIPLVRQLVDQGVLPVAVIGALGGVVGARQYSSQANGQTDAI